MPKDDAKAQEKLADKIRKLHAPLGSANVNEREAARARLEELLVKHKKSWNDLPELLAAKTSAGPDLNDDNPPPPPGRVPAPLDLIHWILEQHLHLTEHQLVAVTLWVAHTHVFDRFSVTPRLAVLSPVRGCGKTTLLDIVRELGRKTRRVDHITAAYLFRRTDRDRATMLLDEVDNIDLLPKSPLRSVINSGHRRGGAFGRLIDGEDVDFSTFAPLALAAIGRLPLPIMQRCIVIDMERSPATLLRFDPFTIVDQQTNCLIVYREVLQWASQCKLDPDPVLPKALINRAADNWRPLISIADEHGEVWGRMAREAAIELSKYRDEDLGVTLLADIYGVFDRRPTVDRLSSAAIVDDLNNMPDALWSEWRGPRDDQVPRRLSQGQLAAMLAPFGIRPKTIWPPQRGASDKSAKGYLRAQFEAAWASYCEAGTPAQPSNISILKVAHHDK